MNDGIRKLVAGVGTLREMDPVIPAAATLAMKAGLPLEVLHAFDVSDPFVHEYLHRVGQPGDPLRRFCEGLQARMEGQVGGLAGHGEVHCRAVAGSPPTVLRDAVRDSDSLLVVGPTRRGRTGSVLLGTTAQRVLHDASVPVLVLRGDLPLPPRVLFCVDLGWPHSAEMVERGLAVADTLATGPVPDTRVLLVVGLELEIPIPGLHDRLAGTACERLGPFVAGLVSGGRMEQRVRTGPPAREIVAEAAEWKADLIVVGTHGRTGAARAILGSVAESVMRDARCAVLVVPPQRS